MTKLLYMIPLCFILSLSMALYFVPVMRRAALKWGVVDKPDGRLKTQQEPVPYLGGVGIYIGFLLSLGLVFTFSPEVLGLLLAATIMLMIGLVDDFGVLLPYQKFAGQVLATFVLVKSGIYIHIAMFPTWVAIALTFFWVIGVINAVNIIDVSDGLSAGVSFIASLVFMVIALINGKPMIAMIAAALAGSLFGFLIYNFHPAKIYLGDTGSLFIGLMLGALAMIGDYTLDNSTAYAAPIIILGVPIFDTFFVMVIRARKGISMFLGSPDHYAIRLKRHGYGTRTVAILSYVVAALLGGLAILNMYLTPVGSTVLLVALAFASLVSAVLFSRIGN